METGNIVHYRQHQKVVQDARVLRRFCQTLPADRKIESYKRPAEKELVIEGKATLSKHNSITILAKFVSSLAEGANTNVAAEYVVSTAGINFMGWVILPDSAPFKSATGSIERSKRQARSAAAYEACVTLIEMGYINKNLQPTFKKKLPKMRNARLALTSGIQQEYSMLVKPDLWASLPTSPPTKLFQTFIELHQNNECITPLAILTRTAMPDVGPIRLFITKGVNTVAKLVPLGPIEFSEGLLQQISSFTLKLFDEVFSKMFDAKVEEIPYYFAPSRPAHFGEATVNVIDWALLSHITTTPDETPDSGEQRFVIDPHNGSRRFIIHQVNPNLRATDPTPAEAPEHTSRGYQLAEKNIMQYSCSTWTRLRSKLNFDPEQPVYNALLLSLRRNFLIEEDNEAIKHDRPCHITLQFLRISSIPANIARFALLLPSILHRLESALIVCQCCNRLGLDIPAELALEAFTQSGVDADDDADLVENERKGIQRNYERLEFLGDTFLKMSTTIALYTHNSKATEFEQHVERMLLVCNKNLFNTALELDLASHVRSGNFDRRTWYPNLRLIHGKVGRMTGRQNIADKTIADVCEALIGAAYLGSTARGNMDEAVKAVTKFVNSDKHNMTSFSDYYANFAVPSWHSRAASAGVQATVERMANTTGYRFQSPLLLRSALTHPSYVAEDIPSYQTLEFLGDALLDLVVVDYLFRKYPNAGPQWLTERKMAVCGNHFLGCLCIDLDIQREILTADAHVPGQVGSFEAKLRYLKECAEDEADKAGRPVTKSYWTLATKPPKLLADVVEALLGAMFVDSHYNIDVVRAFFQRFIQPYFEDLSSYDAFGPGHAITQTGHRLQSQYGCSRWRFCVSEVPCETKCGSKALTECDCICALMIHGKVQWHAKGDSGIEAKNKVAVMAMGELRAMDREQYRKMMSCDCVGGASPDQHVSES